MLKKIGPGIVLLLVGATWTWALSAEEVFEKLREKYRPYGGLKAEFTQVSCDKATGTCRRSAGTLVLARPDKLRMEVSSPKKQLLIADGQFIYLYEPGSKQATKQAMGNPAGQTPLGNLFFGQEKPFDVTFALEDSTPSAGGHPIRLLPKESDAPFKNLALTVDPTSYLCTRVELVTQEEDRNTFELDKGKLLKKVDAKQFVFKPPAGVEVVEAK